MGILKKTRKILKKIDSKTDISKIGKIVGGQIRQTIQNLPAETDTLGFIMRNQRTNEDKQMMDKVSRNNRNVANKMASESNRIANLLMENPDNNQQKMENGLPTINARLF